MSVTNHRRRLDVLMEVLRPNHGRVWTENELGFLTWLDTPALAIVIPRWARDKAERRWLFGHGRPAFLLVGSVPTMNRYSGWSWDTEESDRLPYIRRELADLDALLAAHPLRDALRIWADDTDGLSPRWQAADYASLCRHIDHERAVLDGHRARGGILSKEWRSRHPEWRQDWTADEYDAWEVSMLVSGQAA